MSDGDLLLRQVLRDPDDDVVRLAYADWLTEVGQAERAEFIRAQCELARPLPKTAAQKRYRSELRQRMVFLWETARPRPHSWFTIPGLTDETASFYLPARVRWNTLGGYQVSGTVTRGFVSAIEIHLEALLGGRCEGCHDSDDLPTGAGHANYRRSECPTCSGKGRTPGIAGSLFRSQPVTSVKVTDREPYESGDYWIWVIDPDGNDPLPDHRGYAHFLPRVLWERLENYSTRLTARVRAREYHTRDLALNALSHALVNHCRSVVPGVTHDCPGCKSCLMGPCLVCKGKGYLPGLPPLPLARD